MTDTAVGTGKYRPDIDGLRAIAVATVVAYHTFPSLVKGGFIGVDVFFVISGFLISGILFRSLEAGQFSYADFYARRIRRIFPALVTVCAAVFAVGWFVLLPDEFAQLGKHLAAGAGFVSNLVLWDEAGYFDAAAEAKPLLHLWSLAIEEQFYLLWPLVLGLVWRRRRGLFAATLVIAAVSFAVNVALIREYPVAAFYSPLSRFWELMAGGALAFTAMHRPELLVKHSNWRAAAGLALIAAALVLLTKESSFPGYWALLPTAGAVLLISAGPQAWLNRRVLAARPMVWLGLISYPLYLWHWPVLVFGRIVKGAIPTILDGLIAIAVSIVLSVLTYRLIERRFRHAPSPRVPQGLGVGMVAIALLGLLVLPGILPSRLEGQHISQVLAARYDWEYPPTAAANRSFRALRYFEIEGRPQAFTVFLGDSNLEQYAPRVAQVIKAHPGASNGAVLIGNQRACLLLSEIMTAGSACTKAMDQVRELLATQSTKTVVIAASWMNYRAQLADEAAQQRLLAFLQSLSATKRVYLLLNIPNGPELAPAAMFEGSRLGSIALKPSTRFDSVRFGERYGQLHATLQRLAREAGVTVIDPLATLCRNGNCPAVGEDGTPLYKDDSHITRSYALSSASYIDATLDLPAAAP